MRSISWPRIFFLIIAYAALAIAGLAIIGNPDRDRVRSALTAGYDQASALVGQATFDAAKETERAHAASVEGKSMIRQGDLPGADAAYHRALASFERVSLRDPGNTAIKRDIFVSLMALGLICETTDRLTDARSYYRQAIATLKPIAESDPGNAGWQSDLEMAQERLDAIQDGDALNQPN